MDRKIALPLLAALLLALPGTSRAEEARADIVDTAVAAGSFTTLVKAVQAAGLVDTLKGEGPFTVFAPTDDAFAKIPADQIQALLADKAALTRVLTYHVVPGRVPASEVIKLDWAKTVQGQSVRVQTGGEGEVAIDDARVVKADIHTSNGIIHVIDTVLMPRADIVDTAVKAGSFQTLVKAVQAAGLVETLKGEGPFTVFAPTDSAFAKVPAATLNGLLHNKEQLQAVLTYHVIPGRVLSGDLVPGTRQVETVQGTPLTLVVGNDGSVTVDGANVVKADILTGNGVIHVIDAVIAPKPAVSSAPGASGGSSGCGGGGSCR